MTLAPRRRFLVRATSSVPTAMMQAVRRIAQPYRRRPVTGDAPVVVSITSHGARLRMVHHTIESIARGTVRPVRLIVWVDDEQELARARRSRPLRRLLRRGLELRVGEPCGPHGKWWPYVRSVETHRLPLVTADDDVRYDRVWLEQLVEAHRRRPGLIHCHRAHEMRIAAGRVPRLAPYMTWTPCTDPRPSHAWFVTGVSGVVYPPAFLDALRNDGDGFRTSAPRADDVWLTARAIAHRVRVAQIGAEPRMYSAVIGGQRTALSRRNGTDGGNDGQIAATFRADDLRLIAEDGAPCATGR